MNLFAKLRKLFLTAKSFMTFYSGNEMVGNDDIAQSLKIRKVVHHATAEESGAVFQCRLVSINITLATYMRNRRLLSQQIPES